MYPVILKIIDVLEIKIVPECKQYADSFDAERIKRQERVSLSSNKKARIMNPIQEKKFFEASEGFLYGPKNAD